MSNVGQVQEQKLRPRWLCSTLHNYLGRDCTGIVQEYLLGPLAKSGTLSEILTRAKWKYSLEKYYYGTVNIRSQACYFVRDIFRYGTRAVMIASESNGKYEASTDWHCGICGYTRKLREKCFHDRNYVERNSLFEEKCPKQ